MAACFAALREALRTATKAHAERYFEAHSREPYIGYSLYTDDDVSSIGPVTTRASLVPGERTDDMWPCYMYGPHEWEEFDDYGLFTGVNGILSDLHDTTEFLVYRRMALEQVYEVLLELREEGLFGPRDETRYVVLWLSDSSNPIMDRAAKEFNCPSIYREFVAAYGTAT